MKRLFNLVILGSGLEALALNYLAAGVAGVNSTLITEMATPHLADRYPDRPTLIYGNSQILRDMLRHFDLPYELYKSRVLSLGWRSEILKFPNLAFDWKGLASELAIEASPIVGKVQKTSERSITYESSGETNTIPYDLLVCVEDDAPGTATLWVGGVPSKGLNYNAFCEFGVRIVQTGEFYACSFESGLGSNSELEKIVSLIDDIFEGEFVFDSIDVERRPSYLDLLVDSDNCIKYKSCRAKEFGHFSSRLNDFVEELNARIQRVN